MNSLPFLRPVRDLPIIFRSSSPTESYFTKFEDFSLRLLFVKAAKVLSLSFVFMPLTGCAIATGLVFASLIRGVSYAPDLEEVLFNYTTLGFAFVESFSFLLFFVAAAVMII